MANLANHFQGPLAVRLGYDTERLAAVCERLARAVMQGLRRCREAAAEATPGSRRCMPARMTAVLAQLHEALLAADGDDELDLDPTLAAYVQHSLV